MKFSEERPNDGDTIEALFPDGKWYRVEYSSDGIDGSLWDGDSPTDLDEYPDLQWRSIEGEDMSDLLTGLPSKNEAEVVTLRVVSNVPERLKEFLAQFGIEMAIEIAGIEIGAYLLETKSETAPYLTQHILLLELGRDITVVEAKNGD